MARRGYWKPSKSAKREFAKQMEEISEFCAKNGIHQSMKGDSYYFNINGTAYRVSNHTIEASNRAAYDELTGEQLRELYHDEDDKNNLICITAGKTRIIQIYNDLKAGYELDKRGYRK